MMSWIITFIMAGAVVVSGNNVNDFFVHNQVIQSSGVSQPVLLDETERFEKTYLFDANGRVEVSNINGSITIDTWDRNEIRFSYVKIADKRERLAELDVQIDASPNNFRVETKYDKNKDKKRHKWTKGSKLSVDFTLMVPRTARLDQVESVNGSVTITGTTNYCAVSAINGMVKALSLRGTATLSTVNGKVYAEFDRLDNASAISLESVNGSVDLMIPSDSSATLKAGTVHGGIKNDFKLPVRKGKYVGHDLYGKIGGGDVQIKLSSVNGGLSINRKPDGKDLSPVVNLLETQSTDDDGELEINVVGKAEIKDRVRAKMAAKAKDSGVVNEKEMNRAVLSEIDVEKIAADSLNKAQKSIEALDLKKLDHLRQFGKIREMQMVSPESPMGISRAVFYSPAPYVEEKSETVAVEGTRTIDIDAQSCSVIVRGWEKDEIKYSVTRVRHGAVKSPVFVKREDDGHLKISVETPSDGMGFGKEDPIRLEVFVPKKSNLEIQTQRGLRVEGVSGDIKLKSENGPVDIRDVSGNLNLTAVNKYTNRVRVVGFDGVLSANLVNSDIFLEGDFAKIWTKGKGSRVYLTLDEKADATIETENFGKNCKCKPGTMLSVGGIRIIKSGPNVWRVGEGGPVYKFDLGDSEMIVRPHKSISGP